MKTLTLAFLVAISAVLSPPSMAQEQAGADRYEKPKRFPVLRNAFRQIRSDVRYHAGALRETASGIRQDVKSTILGDHRQRGHSKYGYRGEPAPTTNDNRPPGNGKFYYEEPPPPRREVEHPSRGSQLGVPLENAARQFPEPELDQEPQIVAPRKQAAARDQKQAEPQQTRILPKPESERHPKPESGTESKENPQPAMGKIEYPDAKRSSRPGFHYSPYEPYELLDTQGIEPGALAKDPGNGKIFRIPK